MHKYYRMVDSNSPLFFFEVGGVWYMINNKNQVQRSVYQDLPHLEEIHAVVRALPTKLEMELTNDFIVALVLHTDPTIEQVTFHN